MSTAPFLKFAGPVLDEATIDGVRDVLRSGWITSGPWVQEFERALSTFCDGRPVKAVTSATAAVEIALQLAGIGPGDEVITSAQTFFTVLNMIAKVGATPVFVDCDLVTRNIDLAQVKAAITPRTKAIMPTHWPGSLVDMDALHAIAGRNRPPRDRGCRAGDGIAVEGAQHRCDRRSRHVQLPSEQEHDDDRGRRARRQRRRRGATRRRAALSRHHVSSRPHARRRLSGRQIQPSRRQRADRHRATGAAAHCSSRSDVRSSIATSSASRPNPPCVLPPAPRDGDGQTWNMFSVLLPLAGMAISRQQFRGALEAEGIGTGVSYEALHLSTLGRRYGYDDGDFPVAERIARETVALPLHAAMTERRRGPRLRRHRGRAGACSILTAEEKPWRHRPSRS